MSCLWVLSLLFLTQQPPYKTHSDPISFSIGIPFLISWKVGHSSHTLLDIDLLDISQLLILQKRSNILSVETFVWPQNLCPQESICRKVSWSISCTSQPLHWLYTFNTSLLFLFFCFILIDWHLVTIEVCWSICKSSLQNVQINYCSIEFAFQCCLSNS